MGSDMLVYAIDQRTGELTQIGDMTGFGQNFMVTTAGPDE